MQILILGNIVLFYDTVDEKVFTYPNDNYADTDTRKYSTFIVILYIRQKVFLYPDDIDVIQ